MQQSEILLHPNDHKREKDWKIILGFMDDNLDYKNINNSLDLGGGRGDISYRLLKNNPSGQAMCVDVDQRLLNQAAKRHSNLKVLNFDINNKLPWPDKSFDLVSSICTLQYYYIKDLEKVFAEMVRVSKKYVLVDFLYKNRPWYFMLKIRHPNHKPQFYTQKHIDNLLKKYKLKVLSRVGTRSILGKAFPSTGRTTICLLEKLS